MQPLELHSPSSPTTTTTTHSETSTAVDGVDPESYFATNDPPASLEEDAAKVFEFVERHRIDGKRVVLVTSGGTTVPLENQTVRFVDNFSAGTRGATSAEYFLEHNYAVIFLHRLYSLQPYSRHYTHSKNCFLDLLAEQNGTLMVDPQYSLKMTQVFRKYQEAKNKGLLLMIDFTTVRDYLFLLRRITQLMAPLKERAMYYLAAAVSDFFIPKKRLAEHKIQSSDGALVIKMEQVPKFLNPLVKEWAPKAFVVSFKLETDPNLLIKKAKGSLERYGHQIVIGNLLLTRKRIVTFVMMNGEQLDITLSDDELGEGVEIESKIIPELVKRHDVWLKTLNAVPNSDTNGLI